MWKFPVFTSFLPRRNLSIIDKTQAKMKKIKMPDFLINRLEDGR